mgnify:CR=1 FL=1
MAAWVTQRQESATAPAKDQPWDCVCLLARTIIGRYRTGMEHHVYFWLKDERDNAVDRSVFEKGVEALCLSPNIASSHWGVAAATAERPVTDHSFSYAISLKFDSMESHDRYQEGDPVHDEFIASFKDWWAKVAVMDVA